MKVVTMWRDFAKKTGLLNCFGAEVGKASKNGHPPVTRRIAVFCYSLGSLPHQDLASMAVHGGPLVDDFSH